MTALEEVLTLIAKDEGGVKDVGDGKGVTHYGQTLDWLKTYGLPIPQTPEQAMSNWSVWTAKTKLDAFVVSTYDALAHIIIDFAVHSGSGRAIKVVQSALGVNADGALGPQTIAAFTKRTNGGNSILRTDFACDVIAAELEFQGAIITSNPGLNAQYAKGWMFRNARMIRRLWNE